MKKSYIYKVLLFSLLFLIISNVKAAKAKDYVTICSGGKTEVSGDALADQCKSSYSKTGDKTGRSSGAVCRSTINVTSYGYVSHGRSGSLASYLGRSYSVGCEAAAIAKCKEDSNSKGTTISHQDKVTNVTTYSYSKWTCGEPMRTDCHTIGTVYTLMSSNVTINGVKKDYYRRTEKMDCGYLYTYTYPKYKDNGSKCSEGVSDVYVTPFSSPTGDDYYCVEPSKQGPLKCTNYCLDTTVDLSNCGNPNSSDNFMCGVSQILSYAYDKDTGAKKYSYTAISTALRLWAADWKNQGKANGPAVNSIVGVDGMDSTNSEYLNTNVYGITANYVDSSSYEGGGDCSTLPKGVLCGSDQDYIAGISLYRQVKGATEYEGEIPLGKPKITYVNVDKEERIDASVVFDSTEDVEIECTAEELANPSSNCKIHVQAYQNGQKLETSGLECAGKENGCTFSIYYAKICQKNTQKIREIKNVDIKVTIAGVNRTLIRKYVDCNDPSNKQVMMTYADKEFKKEINSSNPPVETFSDSITINCPCNEEKTCPSEEVVTRFNGQKIVNSNLDSSCSGSSSFGSGEYDTYNSSDFKDPYMNCILNACDLGIKENFNVKKLDPEIAALVNTDVCNVYCRDEVHFYMANKTKVFSGMQFEYDIASSLISDGVIKSAVSGSHKLTSVVLQKRQCTSEIYYDIPNEKGETWLDKYKEKLSKVQDAWKNWKYFESLRKWEDENGGPNKGTSSPKNCYTGTNGNCNDSGNCSYSKTTGGSTVEIHLWPNNTVRNGSNCDSLNTGNGEKYISAPPTSIDIAKNKPNSDKQVTVSVKNQKNSDAKFTDGSTHCGGSCYDTTISCATDTCSNPDENGKCPNYTTSVSRVNTTCTRGSNNTGITMKSKEESAYASYQSAINDLEQWIFDLENCNLYSHDSNKGPDKFGNDLLPYLKIEASTYHPEYLGTVKNKTSIKDELLKKSACTDEDDCIELNFAYQDNNYGDDTSFSRETKISDDKDNLTRSCYNVDDKDPNCYKYQKDTEVEINSANKKQKFDYIYCNGKLRYEAECKVNGRSEFPNGFELPINDFATFMTVTQSDFWQPKKYQVEVYSGLVSEGEGSESNYASLGDEVFPVSNNSVSGKTGIYDTIYKFKNINLIYKSDLNFTNYCAYEIYNTTRLYDCKYNTTGGNLVLEGCNPCYEIVDGVPKICDDWNKVTDSKGYGFIYRNVDAANLFPLNKENNKSVGRNNWLSFKDTITYIESSANKLFVTDELLEYKFILNETAIDRIKEYNLEQNLNGGGYLNQTLFGCEKKTDESGLEAFYDCKSEFIADITNNDNNFGIKTIQAGKIDNYGY